MHERYAPRDQSVWRQSQKTTKVTEPTLRNELIIRLMWQTGVRKTELIDIELDHLDRDSREIRIWTNKSKQRRTVHYRRSLGVLLDRWIDRGHRASYVPAESSEYLFVTERSESPTSQESSLEYLVHRRGREGGLRAVRRRGVIPRDAGDSIPIA